MCSLDSELDVCIREGGRSSIELQVLKKSPLWLALEDRRNSRQPEELGYWEEGEKGSFIPIGREQPDPFALEKFNL